MAIIPADEKVFMVDKRTNTIYGGSQALQDMQQWYTMQDVSDSVQPYKVFTALLTQSGESGPNQDSEFPLEVGVSYTIFSEGAYILGDFTNVGAPNNEIGTIFIATGTTPNSWGSNISLSWDTGAPVATVLENTIGNIWFTYTDVGNYYLYSDNAFITGKTWNTKCLDFGINGSTIRALLNNNEDLNTMTLYIESDYDTPADGILYNTPIEIRVYN